MWNSKGRAYKGGLLAHLIIKFDFRFRFSYSIVTRFTSTVKLDVAALGGEM